MRERKQRGEVVFRGCGLTGAVLGSDLGWSDCGGHIPNRHTVLPVRDLHYADGPHVLGRDWRLLLWAPVQGLLRFVALALDTLTALPLRHQPSPAGWMKGQPCHLGLSAMSRPDTRAASLALAAWLSSLSLNVLCGRMGPRGSREGHMLEAKGFGPKTGILLAPSQARACPALARLSHLLAVPWAWPVGGCPLSTPRCASPSIWTTFPAGLPASPCPGPPL